MERIRFAIPKMDCPAEEQLVRLALKGQPHVVRIAADLATRELTVDHNGDTQAVTQAILPLNLGARVVETRELGAEESLVQAEGTNQEVGTLRLVLAINATMFVGEVVGAYIADSSALLADSLDMFADAAVYGIALYGAGRAAVGQRRAARISGVVQLALALDVLTEVAWRALMGSEPEPTLIVTVGLVALGANITCLWLLARHRKGGAHMKASWIFTTNDVIANVGVLCGAGLVRLTGSPVPDLVVGTGIALVVLSGALRILRL